MARAKEQYGKIPEAEYSKLIAKATSAHAAERSLREDYDLYVNLDGFFRVDYSAFCDKCQFSFKFNHVQQAME